MTRVSLGIGLFLLLLLPPPFVPCPTFLPFAQDDGQKNTALLRIYPGVDRITTGVDNLAKDNKHSVALGILAEAMESHPNHLVPIHPDNDAKRQAVQYLGVTEYVRGLITKWVAENDEARAAVRAYFDPVAKAMFEAAKSVGDRQALAFLIESYPFSSWADDALMLRGLLEFDAGEPTKAVDTFERLVAWKETDLPLALIYARLGQAYSRAGRRDQLAALVSKADRDAGQEKIRAGDRDMALGDFLRAELKRVVTSPSAMVEPTGGWESFAGSGDGSRIVEAADLGQYAWKASLELARFTEADDRYQYGRAAGVPSTYRPFFPAVSDGIVYVHGEYSIAAYNLFGAGEQLWQHKERVPAGDLMFEDRVMHAATVVDGRVYANLVTWLDEYETQHSFITVKFPFPKRQLICFDAYTGKVLWRMGGLRFQKGGRPGDALSFSAPPTPHKGLLYVTAIRQDHQTDPFEHHVLCIDPDAPDGGRIVWSTFVASGGTEINLFGNSTRESTSSPVAVTDDSVLVCTNHGAVGCVDRRSGRLRWVAKYQQLPVAPTRSVNVRRNPPEWTPTAPVVGCGQVCVAPSDSPWLYGFDLRDGKRLWEKGRARDIRTIYGISGTRLVVGGDAIEWYDLASKETPAKLADRFVPTQGGRGAGRGLIAADGVYLPMTDGLYKVKTGKGRPEATFLRWPGRTDGGNLVVADGAIIVASLDEMVAFYDRKDVEKQIKEELEKDPNNTVLLYRSALRMLQSGKVDEATDLLSRVVKLTAKSTRPVDERIDRAARKRLYTVALNAGREAMNAKAYDTATTAFRRARDAALDAPSQTTATISLAGALTARKEFATALNEYQKLIEQRGDDVAAFEAARAGIAAILQLAGRDVYKDVERDAEKLLAQGDGLVVFRRYPNSAAAEKGMFETAMKSDDAAIFRMFLQHYPESARIGDAQAALVRTLEKQALYGAAAVVLRKMAKHPAREVKDGERIVTAKEFVESRLSKDAYKLATAGAPPPLKPPLSKIGTYSDKDFAEGAPLAVQGPAFARGAGHVFIGYRAVVKAVDPGKGAEAWRLTTDGPVRAAFSYDDSLILCTNGTILRVNPATGAVDWKYSHRTSFTGFGLVAGTICFLAPDPRNEILSQVGAIDTAKGTLLWASNYEGAGVPRLLEYADSVVLVSEGPYRIYMFDVESGRRTLVAGMMFASGNADVLGIAGDQLIIHLAGRSVQAYQLPSGAVKWTRSLESLELRAIDISPTATFFLAERLGKDWQKELVAYTIDHKTGKIAQMKERPELDEPLDARIDGDRVIVFSRTADGAVRVRALSMAGLTELWKVDFGKALGRVGGMTRTPGHLLVVGGDRLESGCFNYSAVLLDREGKKLQAFKGEGTYERPPGWTVTGGSVVFSVDNRIECWTGK